MKMKRQLALLVIVALLIGLLPMGNVTVSEAASPETKEKDSVYLEDIPIIECGEYDGNEGDSFVYPIGSHQYTRGNVGVDGNTYSHGIEVWVARWNYTKEKSWTYATFDLDKRYTKLSGRALLIDSYNVTDFDTTLYFYGDGQLIQSYQMTPQTMPFDITLDVLGIDNLKIYAEDNGYFQGGTSFGLTEMALTKSGDSDNINDKEPIQKGLNNPTTDADGVITWDCVWFGNYWQEDTNGDGKADKNDEKTPIKWRVLSVDGDDAFLLADKNIDVQRYNKNYTFVTWETSTMRSWLNGYGAETDEPGEDFSTNNFLNSAFSGIEQRAIRTTNVVNDDNPYYEVEGGNNTFDKVYLLSIDEVTNPAYGFSSDDSKYDEARKAKNTKYVADGGEIKSGSMSSAGSAGGWWLRSSGGSRGNRDASRVNHNGDVYRDGHGVNMYYSAVRPTLHLNLSATSSWSYAGTVTSKGGETGTVTPRPGTTEEPSQTDEPLFTWPPEPTATPKSPEAQAAENITAAFPDLDDLGSAELKGPELNIAGNQFNLFKTKIGMSLPVFNNTQINIDHKNHTAEVLLGLEGGADASVKADPDDTYWRESYQEVKSLVKACGGKVDTTKLWNRFSKLRGKLKKIDGEAAFKVSGNAAGYIKLELDENDKPVRLVEGGVMAGLEASGKVKTPLWWIVYSEFGVGGSVDGKLTLTTENTKTIQVQGELGLTIKPSIALGADAVVVDVKGGIEGEIGGKVQIPWKSFEECVSAWLTGKLFVKVDTVIPGLKGGYDYDFPRMELYPELGKIEKRNFVMEYERGSSPTREEVGEIRRYASGTVDGAEQSLVYENAKPEMVQLPDGRILMTYLDDTLQGAEGQAKLMYRLYEDGTWSSGKPVNANTNLDTAGKLCVYGGKAYVLYENSRQPVTEQMTEKEILDSMDLYAASFDASLDCFGTSVGLGEVSGKESSWKYGYDLVADGTSLKAVWAENSGGDVLLNSGNTVFYKSSLSGTEWEEKNEIRSVTGAVQEFSMWEEDGTLRLAYIKDGKLYMDGTLCDNITGKADSVKIFDGQMYLRLDGMLYRWENGAAVSLGTACTTSYRVLNGTVYWTEQDNFKSEIYKKEISVTGRPVAVTADGGYIGGFSLLKQEDAELLLSYTLQSVHGMTGEESPYGLTVLKSKEELSRNQAEVTDLAYDILSFVPGEDNDIAVSVANTGTTELTQVKVTISDDSGNVLHEEVVSARMKPGEVLEKHLSVQIPKELAAGSIRAGVSAEESFASDDQASETLELETNAADLQITSVDEDTVCITNLSDSPAEEIKLEVKDGDETGTLLQSGEIQTLAAGEKKTISVEEAWKSSTINPQTGERYLHCEVTQKEDEYTLWNNSIQIQKQGSWPQPPETAAPSPTKPANTQRPQQTVAPGSFPVITSVRQPGSSVTQQTTIPSASGKGAVGKVSSLKLKQKKQSVTASWKKVSGASGYQICYSTSKKWKGQKQKMIRKNKVTIKKLKKSKTYYFRIRAYRLDGTKKVYGAWSSTRKIKIKK